MDLPSIPFRGPRSPCEERGCSACCHDIEMLLTEDDLARIRAATGRDDFHEVADDGFLQLKTKDAPPAAGWNGGPSLPTPELTELPRPCIFLGPEGLCKIHAARPEGCRLYPATWDGVLAELDTDYCPHTEGFVMSGQASASVRRLAERLEQERLARARRPR